MLPVRGFQLQPSSLKSVLLFYFFQQYWLFYKIPPSLFFFCLFLFFCIVYGIRAAQFGFQPQFGCPYCKTLSSLGSTCMLLF